MSSWNCSKIVSVKLDNGEEYEVDDDCIRRYLETRDFEEAGRVLGGSPLFALPSSTVRSLVTACANIRREDKSETNSTNASGQRNSVTKAELVAFKTQHEIDNGMTHRWKAAACVKFLIDPKTLKSRMQD